ncbi:hypothetical protein UCRPC4_g02013 [Phaeomoniella chlamydospora]|uniref:Uncharacterized protein n=1 Tax=Phaeomoniella chlamydospora TaxID=158046 RepID=A0A0G2EQZ4_PHACM|nr:hypothetical protein UCRPC4_g02013 [Phaeomoniella chlamydospora]
MGDTRRIGSGRRRSKERQSSGTSFQDRSLPTPPSTEASFHGETDRDVPQTGDDILELESESLPWPLSNISLFEDLAAIPAKEKGDYFLNLLENPSEFEGFSYLDFYICIHEFIESHEGRTHSSIADLVYLFIDTADEIRGSRLQRDLKLIINQNMSAILESGLLEEWWDAVTLFLFNTHRFLRLRILQPRFGTFDRSAYDLWLQAVEGARCKYCVATGRQDLVKDLEHSTDYYQGLRDFKFLIKDPLQLYHHRDTEGWFTPGDEAPMNAAINWDIEYLNKTMHDDDSDPATDIEMACVISKDIRAYPQINWTSANQTPFKSMTSLFNEWRSTKLYKILDLVEDIHGELEVDEYDGVEIEKVERWFEKVIKIASGLRFLQPDSYFLSAHEMDDLENHVQERLIVFRENYYINGPESAQLLYLLSKVLQRLYNNPHLVESTSPPRHGLTTSPHRELDFRFLQENTDTFRLIQKSYIYSRRLMHLTVARYCDRLYGAVETIFRNDITPSEVEAPLLQSTIRRFQHWLKSPGLTQRITESFHRDLHVLALRLRHLTNTHLNFPLSFFPFYRQTSLHHLYSPETPAPADINPLPLSATTSKNPPYTRFITGSGEFFLAETAAVAKAHSQRIQRSLTEPGIEEPNEPYDVNCEVDRIWKLPDTSSATDLDLAVIEQDDDDEEGDPTPFSPPPEITTKDIIPDNQPTLWQQIPAREVIESRNLNLGGVDE